MSINFIYLVKYTDILKYAQREKKRKVIKSYRHVSVKAKMS